MADFRGQDGSASVAAVGVGELKTWSLDGVTVETIDRTVKGDAVRRHRAGLGDGGSATLTCNLDYATSQQDLIDFCNDPATIPLAGVAIVLTADTGKTFSFNAIPTGYSTNSPEGSALDQATFNLKVTGAVAVAWV